MKARSQRSLENRIVSASLCHAGLTEKERRALRTSEEAEITECIKRSSRMEVEKHLAEIDPSLAYGCVDWYLYPDLKRGSQREGPEPHQK